MFTNILIFNDPETIDIANGLVYCKNKGGLAYLPYSTGSGKCKDGAFVKLLEDKEVIKYYQHISKDKFFGINFIDYTNFNYSDLESK